MGKFGLSRLITVLFILIVLGIFLLLGAAIVVNRWINTPLNLDQEKILLVASGDNIGKIARQLAREGILHHPRLLIVYAKLSQQTQLKIGEYRIPKNATPKVLLSVLLSDDVVTYQITLIEGKTFKDFLEILAKEEKLDKTLTGKTFEDIKKIMMVRKKKT